MLKATVERLRAYILESNPYFDEGLANVYMDATQGLVDEDGPVFPDDTRGNYFYLRLPDNVGLQATSDYQINDCITGLGVSANIVLVAVMKDADEDKLISNLVNTLQAFSGVVKTFTGAIYKREVVVRQELSFMGADNLQAALQRIPDVAIVSVNFSITTLVQYNSCIINPCVTC